MRCGGRSGPTDRPAEAADPSPRGTISTTSILGYNTICDRVLSALEEKTAPETEIASPEMDLERQQPADEREEKTAPETEIASPEMDLERQQPADEREEKTAPETEISSPEMDLERQQPADESITAVPSGL